MPNQQAGKEHVEGDMPSKHLHALQQLHHQAAIVDIQPDHMLGVGLGKLSMAQLEVLTEMHLAAIKQIEGLKIKQARLQEREHVEAELLLHAEKQAVGMR